MAAKGAAYMDTPRHLVPTCLLLTSVFFGLAGCFDRTSVTAPESSPGPASSFQAIEGRPTVAAEAAARSGQYRRIWPHEDGRGWTYHLTARSWAQPAPVVYPSPEEVPELTMDDAIRLLGREPGGPDPETNTGTYRLQFNGLVTTMSGVTRQNLQATLVPDAPAAISSATAPQGQSFLQLLCRARPDIARKLGLHAPSIANQAAASLFRPTLLHGYAWEQTDRWIGTYGDLNQQIAWIFLTPDLRPGSEFSLQLVPDLADDVFLHARILDWKSVETEAGTFHHALEVVYLVDFGISQATDVNGNPLGYIRPYLYGSTDYAVGVGPVRSYERLVLGADLLGRGNSDLTASLTGSSRPIP